MSNTIKLNPKFNIDDLVCIKKTRQQDNENILDKEKRAGVVCHFKVFQNKLITYGVCWLDESFKGKEPTEHYDMELELVK